MHALVQKMDDAFLVEFTTPITDSKLTSSDISLVVCTVIVWKSIGKVTVELAGAGVGLVRRGFPQSTFDRSSE